MKYGILKTDPRKILIVKPSSLGDVVHSLPFLNALNRRFPKAKIHWIVAKGFEGLLEGHPMIDRLWIINKDTWKKIKNLTGTISELRKLSQNLREENYDLVVDLQGLLRSGVITKATGAPVQIGFEEAREGSRYFYTHKVAVGRDIHAVDRYLKIAEYLGCDVSQVCFPFPDSGKGKGTSPLPLSSKDYAVLVPGARWKTKRWPPEKFGEIASLLPLTSIIVGSKGDAGIADEIVSLSNGNAISLAGKTTLKELIEIMRGAKFAVTNDSGPMHIAAALGISAFAIFGPTDAARTGPYGDGHAVIREEVSCAPCFRRNCADMRCMKDLSAGKVLKIIESKETL